MSVFEITINIVSLHNMNKELYRQWEMVDCSNAKGRLRIFEDSLVRTVQTTKNMENKWGFNNM